jgi:hypothetical protein
MTVAGNRHVKAAANSAVRDTAYNTPIILTEGRLEPVS